MCNEIIDIYKELSDFCLDCDIFEIKGNFLELFIRTKHYIPFQIRQQYQEKGIVFVKKN